MFYFLILNHFIINAFSIAINNVLFYILIKILNT